MQNKVLYTSGLKLIALAGIVLLSSCTAPANHDTTPSSGNPLSGKSNQVVQTASGISLACTAPLLRPARFITRNERIRVFEAAPEFKNIPATTDWGIKRIQIEPARFSHEIVPALYREETEQVLLLRERDELQGIPAVYRTTDKPVTIMPAHTRWKSDCTAGENPLTCFENVPAKTRILKQQTVDIPSQIVQKRIPAKTMAVTKKILVKSGRGTGPVIPARYIDVKVGRVTSAWKVHSTYATPRYERFPVQVKSREEQIKPFPVMCSDAPPVQVKKLQHRLVQRGFPTSASGSLDTQTLEALTRFQQSNDLFIGAVSHETLEKLGLK